MEITERRVDSVPDPESFLRDLPWKERFLLKMGKAVRVARFQLPGWSGGLDFFLFRCRCGRLHVDYRHGHRGNLHCQAVLRN